MESIYTFLDLPLNDQARKGMQDFLTENALHQHGAHKYKLEDFGLSRDEVDTRLAFYRERYNIPYETSNPHLAASKETRA